MKYLLGSKEFIGKFCFITTKFFDRIPGDREGIDQTYK